MAQVATWADTSAQACAIVGEVFGVQPPVRPNTVAGNHQSRVLWLGPDRWLLVWEAGVIEDFASTLEGRFPSQVATVVELSGGRSVFVLSGLHARDVLAKHVPIDLSEPKFRVGSCAQSAIGNIGVLLHAESEDAIEIYVYRGFAQHLWEMLVDSGEEFGVEVNSEGKPQGLGIHP
jgi:sarcosine oxidase subunit gamma